MKLPKIKLRVKTPAKFKKVFTKKRIVVFAAFIIAALFIYFGKSLIFAAWVNNRPITRISLIRELEKQGGQQVLENMIDKALISQEAKKQKVVVNADEVDLEIKNIEDIVKAQGLTLEDALAFRGQTRADLVEQIKFQKEIEKLLASRISITDTEIKDYFDKNKTTFPTGSTLEGVTDQIKTFIFQEKISDEYTKWLAELRTNAKINYFLTF